MLLDAGAPVELSARGDGGTPLVVALFWGHRETAELLAARAWRRATCASRPGSGACDLTADLAGTPAAGAHRGFYRPHSGFPAWQPSDDPQEVLDEALSWAARSDRVEALAALVGARRGAGRRSLPRHRARVGRRLRARRGDPPAGRARAPTRASARRSVACSTARASTRAAPRGAERRARHDPRAARARCRPDDRGRPVPRHARRLGRARRPRGRARPPTPVVVNDL